MRKLHRGLQLTGLVAAALAASLVFAGCSSGKSTTDSSGKTVLTVYGWKGTKGEPANVSQINAAFEKANPYITLKYEALPANDPYAQRVQPELLAGTSADVLMVDSKLLSTWGKAGYLADLSGEDWAPRVAPEIKPFASYNGKVTAMPMETIGVGLYSNLDVLKKAGISQVPTDWPSFLDALARLKAAGNVPLSLPDKGGWTGSEALLNSAATLVDKKWDEEFYNGSASFSSWKPAVDQLLELDSKGFVSWKTELGVDEWSQGLNDFTAGKTGFWLQGAWNLGAVKDAGIKAKFSAWPAGDKGSTPNALVYAGTMWALNQASSVKDAAKKYIEFWSQPANLKPYLEAENAISPFTNGDTPQTEETKGFLASYKAGNFRFMQANTWMAGDVQTQMGSSLQGLFLGQTSTDKFLKEMDGIAHRKNK